MKVLQIVPELNLGGVERGTVDLAGELLRQGHQALVISNGGRLVKELEALGARHFSLPVHKKSLFTILANIPKVTKILEKERPDIVHARSRIPALIAFFACRRTGTTFITTCHGYYSRNFFSRIMGWGKLVIVSSNAIARHMIKDFGVPGERIRLIPRGVNLEEFKFGEKRKDARLKEKIFTVGVMARLTPIKGHQYFLQALAKVTRSLPGVRAFIIGEPSPGKEKYKEELQMLTRRLSLDKYVEFISRVSNVPQILSQLDVLVLPTVTQEAFGRVLIEAGASGVPVIATEVGGIVDIIEHEVNGILVKPKDPYGLSAAIIRLFNEPQLRMRLAHQARKKVEQNFSLKEMAAKTIQVYQEAQRSLKVLVIKLSALGDVILSIPSLKALRENFPQAHIVVLVGKPFRQVLENCPYLDEIIELALEDKSYRHIWRTSSLLRRLDCDVLVDLQNSRHSHLLAYLSGCNRRYGYDNGKFGFLLNRRIKETKLALSPIEHQARTLQLLDIDNVREDLQLWPSTEDENWAQTFINKNKKKKDTPLIGINIGVSLAWPSKRWAIEKIAQLLDKMGASGMEVLVTGKGNDKELARKLKKLSRPDFIDAVNETKILQLACLIKHCNVYITSDSAPLHLAYAVKTPVVALFGPTDSRRHTILNAKQVLISKQLDCSPCYKRRCQRHSCMEDISVEEVFEAVKRLLKGENE